MLKVTNLSKAYGDQVLFDRASFTVNPGEKIGLVGRNGHGKTTLFRLVQREELPDEGELSLPNHYYLGYLEQHLKFTKPTLREEVCLGLPTRYKYEEWRGEKILFGLGFTREDLSRSPREFSGGFQVRLNLAKVLVAEPNLLLLDEPTNYLDISSIRWLIRFLKSWKNELILITHDRGFMDSVITHTVGIHRRQIRKISGKTEKYYEQIAKEEEIYEKTRLNEEKKRKEVETFIERFRYKATLSSRVQSRVKALEKKGEMEKLAALENLEFTFPYAPIPAKTILTAENLCFSYQGGDRFLIDDFSLTIGKEDRIAVIGKNGKGKSTLLKLLAHKLIPKQGRISEHPKLVPGYFGQTNIMRLNPEHTVVEEIMSTGNDCSLQKARNIAGSLMFQGDLGLKKISVLSGGEKSRVLLGKILVSPSNLLFLDEPTNHLDMESSDSLMEAIDAYEGAVVIVTHNEMFLHALANRLIIFDRDRIFIYEGSSQTFLEQVGWESDEGDNEPRDDSRASLGQILDKKTLRKEKALIIQEKSEVLRPLEKEIARVEKGITDLETELSQNNLLLVEFSSTGEGEQIAVYAKRNMKIQEELEALYDQLASITEQYEKNSALFAEQLQNYL